MVTLKAGTTKLGLRPNVSYDPYSSDGTYGYHTISVSNPGYGTTARCITCMSNAYSQNKFKIRCDNKRCDIIGFLYTSRGEVVPFQLLNHSGNTGDLKTVNGQITQIFVIVQNADQDYIPVMAEYEDEEDDDE